jgi:sugar lactone lactonase YvrE
LGLANAFASVNNLVDITQGISPGSAAPAGAVLPVAKVYTLANILASCINSSPSTACNALFSAATPPSGTTPSDTISAALEIARNPSHNVASLFALATPQPPFVPALSTAPGDWTVSETFKGGGQNLPSSIAIDASGNVWTANVCSSSNPCSSVTELSPTGQPLSTSGFTNGTLFESYGLALDLSGNVWVTSQQSPGVNNGNGSVTELTGSGQVGQTFFGGGVFFPIAVATDTDGSVWIANQGDSSASKLDGNGSPKSGSSGWGSGHLAGPVAVAIDASHNAWFANQEASSGSVTSISPDGSIVTEVPSGGYQPSGVATDAIGVSTNASKGHVWVANYHTSSISELLLNNDGTQTVVSSGYTGGGISYPNGVAVDGSGNVWVADFGGDALSELEGANGSIPGQPLSPATGFGVDAGLANPYGVALDSSGNIWISNSGSNAITQFLGLATPVKTPLVGPPQLP